MLTTSIGHLRRAVTSASGVLILITVGNVLLRMVSSVTLTRLVTPDVFGVIGIIGSVFFTIAMLTDMGFNAYIIRHDRGDESHFLDVVWTIHAVRGFVLAGIGALVAPGAAWLLQKPEVALPMAVASLTLLIGGVSSFSLITRLRVGGARSLSIFDFVMSALQTVANIVLAIWLRSVWALIWAMIVQSVVRAVLSYLLFSGSRQRLAFDRSILKDFLGFSRFVIGSSLLSLIIGQLDKLVLARLFSLEQFGLYAIALSLASAPAAFADAYAGRVIFPEFARLRRQAPDLLAASYYRVGRLTVLLFAAGCGALMSLSPVVIALLYPARYADTSIYLALLIVGTAIHLPTFVASEYLTAKGNLLTPLHANIARLGWLVAAVPLGYWLGGPLAIVAAVAISELPSLVLLLIRLRNEDVLHVRHEAAYWIVFAAGALAAYPITMVTSVDQLHSIVRSLV